jgi:ssDNA-binding replication factor A large subunit
MKIAELEENSKVVNLNVEIQTLEDVQNTETGKTLQEGVVSDDSGQVKITFWDDQVGKYKQGDKITMVTGWCKSFEGELQISSGKFGKIYLTKNLEK